MLKLFLCVRKLYIYQEYYFFGFSFQCKWVYFIKLLPNTPHDMNYTVFMFYTVIYDESKNVMLGACKDILACRIWTHRWIMNSMFFRVKTSIIRILNTSTLIQMVTAQIIMITTSLIISETSKTIIWCQFQVIRINCYTCNTRSEYQIGTFWCNKHYIKLT